MRFEVEVIARGAFADIETGQPRKFGERFEIKNVERFRNLIGRRLVRLVSISTGRRKKGKTILVLLREIAKVGGIETACYNLAKTFSERKLVFIAPYIDPEQAIRIANYADVVVDDREQTYEGDVAIYMNYDGIGKYKGRTTARKCYHLIHSDWQGLKKYPQWKSFQLEVDKSIDKVVAVSETAKKGLLTAFNKPIKSEVVPNILCPPNPDENFRIFLFLSRTTEEKGLDVLAKMAMKFAQAGKEFLFIITGNQARLLGRGAEKEALRSHAMFMPQSPNNIGLISKADYLVQLSSNESYCYSVREALQRQTPVIATRIPEFTKLVKEGKNGYLVNNDLSDLDIDRIFNERPEGFPAYSEKVSPKWEKMLNGEL